MKTSIIIPTHNKVEYTKQCIESIRKYTELDSYEIIVIDNASTDGTLEWLPRQEDIQLIKNNVNEGFVRACNQGLEAAIGDNILLLNNDTIVTENWLHNLINCLYSDKKIGAVGPVTNYSSYYQTIDTPFETLDQMQDFARTFNFSDPAKWEQRLKLVGFCMLIKKEVVKSIGLLDERFSPGNYEDDDYSFRIIEAGYRLMLCNDTFIYHFGSVSFSESPSGFNQLLQENDKKFNAKWGFNSSYSTNIRYDLISLMNDETEKPIKVLEVGCGCGGTLLKIKHLYKNATLYGIELNPNSARIASFVAQVETENIEEERWSYADGFFDYIIFGDVLEHLYDPWKVVKNIKKLLSVDGKLLISIPNVMHLSVLRDLINGKWTYTDAGILDRTHLRFFTLMELHKMLVEAGYQDINYTKKVIVSSEDDEKFIDQLCKLSNENMKELYNAYQYLVRAR